MGLFGRPEARISERGVDGCVARQRRGGADCDGAAGPLARGRGLGRGFCPIEGRGADLYRHLDQPGCPGRPARRRPACPPRRQPAAPETVADGPARDAKAVRRFRAEQFALARDLAVLFNSHVSEDDWLLVVPMRELDLALTLQPLVIRLAPTSDEVEAAIRQPLPQIEPLLGDRAEDVLLTIVLDALGLERHVALFEQLRDDRALAAALKDAAAAVKAQRYGLAALELERLMRVMVLPSSVAAVAENLGMDSRRKLYKSLVVRFVPFIGWTFFDTLLLATVYYNREPPRRCCASAPGRLL